MSSDDVMKDSLVATRSRRTNAGSRLKSLLQAEEILNYNEEDENVDLLFQENGSDAEFSLNDSESDEEADEADEADEEDQDEEAENDSEGAPRGKKRQRSASVKSGDNEDEGVEYNSDEMFSDSDESTSEEEDEVAGEKELEKQERIKKRKESKKKKIIPKILKPKTPAAVAAASEAKKRHKRAPDDGIKADALLSENRRSSTRKAAIQNKIELVNKLKESERRRAAMKPKPQKEVHIKTQEEKLLEAIETEKQNIEALTRFREQEVIKKQKRSQIFSSKKVLTDVVRFISKIHYVTPKEELTELRKIQEKEKKKDRRGRKSEKQKQIDLEEEQKQEDIKKLQTRGRWIELGKTNAEIDEIERKQKEEEETRIRLQKEKDEQIKREREERIKREKEERLKKQEEVRKRVEEYERKMKEKEIRRANGIESDEEEAGAQEKNKGEDAIQINQQHNGDENIVTTQKENKVQEKEPENGVVKMEIDTPQINEEDEGDKGKNEKNGTINERVGKEEILNGSKTEQVDIGNNTEINETAQKPIDTEKSKQLQETEDAQRDETSNKVTQETEDGEPKTKSKLEESMKKTDIKTELETDNVATVESGKLNDNAKAESQDNSKVGAPNGTANGEAKPEQAEYHNATGESTARTDGSAESAKESTACPPITKKVTFADDITKGRDEEESQAKLSQTPEEPINVKEEDSKEQFDGAKEETKETKEMTNEHEKPRYEGPLLKVFRNYIALDNFNNPKTLSDKKKVKEIVLGPLSLWSAHRRSNTVERIIHIKSAAGSSLQSTYKSDLFIPYSELKSTEFEELQKFPRLGVVDTNDQNLDNNDKKVEALKEINIKTPAPSSIYLPTGLKKTCFITGKEALYFEPKTGIPYGSVEAYKVIDRIKQGEFAWCSFGEDKGAYMFARYGEPRPAKGVPPGFADD